MPKEGREEEGGVGRGGKRNKLGEEEGRGEYMRR